MSESNVLPAGSAAVRMRDLSAADRAPLAKILSGTGSFSDEEVDVALELIDHGIYGTDPDYRFVVADAGNGSVAGYVCIGRAPMTDGTFDLYWIAVDKARQGSGIGKLLMGAARSLAQKNGGRMILVETASKESYAATRAFYEKSGFTIWARVPDFYSVGDDKLIYGIKL